MNTYDITKPRFTVVGPNGQFNKFETLSLAEAIFWSKMPGYHVMVHRWKDGYFQTTDERI